MKNNAIEIRGLRKNFKGFSLGPLTLPPLYGVSQVVLGMVFILVMVYRPQGLLGDRELRLVSDPPPSPMSLSVPRSSTSPAAGPAPRPPVISPPATQSTRQEDL